MKILHAFWLPEPNETFVQGGALWLWTETLPQGRSARAPNQATHPFQLPGTAWPGLLDELGLAPKSARGAPALTSVIGNWQKEAERFAPQLPVLTAPGQDRQVIRHFKAEGRPLPAVRVRPMREVA